MLCPRCNSEMLDVRAAKTNPKAPDFQCPDPNCLNEKGYRTGAWLPKGKVPPQTGYAAQQAPKQPFTERPAALSKPEAPLPWEASPKDEQLVKLYWACFDEVLAGLKSRALRDGFNDEQIAACTATLFIARSRLL